MNKFSLEDIAVWGAFDEAQEYGDMSKLVEYVERGHPEIMANPEIRKYLADRLRGVSLRGKGEKPVSRKREEKDIHMAINMVSFIAKGDQQYSSNPNSTTAASKTAIQFHVSESVVKTLWRRLKREYKEGQPSHVLTMLCAVYPVYRIVFDKNIREIDFPAAFKCASKELKDALSKEYVPRG